MSYCKKIPLKWGMAEGRTIIRGVDGANIHIEVVVPEALETQEGMSFIVFLIDQFNKANEANDI